MLAGPVFVTMATEAKVESGRGREPSCDRSSLRPDWLEIKGGGGVLVGCWVGNDVTCSPVSRWEGSSPNAPAGSKHRHNGLVFKVGLSWAAGTQAGFYTDSRFSRALSRHLWHFFHCCQGCVATWQHCTHGTHGTPVGRQMHGHHFDR